MANLPEEITSIVLELQRQLLSVINQSTATAFVILETYGETDNTIISLNDLDNKGRKKELELIMTQEQFTPDIEQIKATSAKVQQLCQRADAGIAILDDLIAQIEADIRASKLYQYRLNKAKRLLKM